MPRTAAKTEHILGRKTNFREVKRVQVMQTMFSDHNGIKLEINHRKISGKSPNIQKLNNMHLNNPQVKGEIKRQMGKHLELNKNENLCMLPE